MNSERIRQQFGSYGVEVLQSDFDVRISSLYSFDYGEKICRTYAVVEFMPPHAEYARELQRVLSEESIGAVFKESGWTITKETLAIGQIEIVDPEQRIVSLMRVDTPVVLASHRYIFRVAKNNKSFDYAIITETHHPEYLDFDGLKRIAGSISSSQIDSQVQPCPVPVCQ